jgi:Tfp pilus assembly protein PilF
LQTRVDKKLYLEPVFYLEMIMATNRLNQLLEYYQEEPNDPFNIYALALEYSKYDAAKAKEFFDLLLDKHEDYIPTYYHAARLYQDTGQKEKAVRLYEKGITIARKHHDLKAARELQSAYDELLFE